MSQHDKINRFIQLIRGTHLKEFPIEESSVGIITEVFTRGNCGNFAKALQLVFGGDIVSVDDNQHVLCKIEDKLYDINGDVTHIHSDYTVATDWDVDWCIDNYSFADRGPVC